MSGLELFISEEKALAEYLSLEHVDWYGDLHWFEIHDLLLLLDVNSGAVHVVDAAARTVLEELREKEIQSTIREEDWLAILPRSVNDWGGAIVKELYYELTAKQAEGSLFTADAYASTYRPPQSPVQALCLHVAHDCNMRCRYCFAGGGPFGGRPGMMSKETGFKALDFLFAHSGNRPRVEVDFFGGEPLVNFGVVRELVDYGRQRAINCGKEINFTLTTNGLALTETIARYLVDQEISVIMSLDGRKPVNDHNRHTLDGRGTYDAVVPREQYFVNLQGHKDYWLRGTYTSYNIDFSADVQHMADLGFRHISLEPVVSDPENEYAIKEKDLPALKEEYRRLALLYLEAAGTGKAFDFFHFNVDPRGGPCLTKRLTGCGAGTSYLAVTPDGELYPCHQFVGREDFYLGNVYQGIIAADVRRDFRHAYIYNKPACRRCWARFLCSGGCHAGNVAATGSLYEPAPVACAIQKMRLEAAYYVQLKRIFVNQEGFQ